MTADDVGGVVVIENASYTDPWTTEMFVSALDDEHHRLVVACSDGGAIGYGVLRVDDWVGRVLSVAVDPSHRNRAVGRAIMLELVRLGGRGRERRVSGSRCGSRTIRRAACTKGLACLFSPSAASTTRTTTR